MPNRGSGRKGRRPRRRRWGGTARTLSIAIFAAIAGGAAYVLGEIRSDAPVRYSSIEEHVKYGSTGSERYFGIPYAIFRVLPMLCRDYLPSDEPGYASLGFIYERGRELPIGFSRREYRGEDLVGLNCGACHVGQIKDGEGAPARIHVGMPANTADIGGLQRFLSSCASDPRFTAARVLEVVDEAEVPLGWIDRARLRFGGVERAKERLQSLSRKLEFIEDQPPFGPGRVDTVNATKALFGIDLGAAERRPVATVDFAAVWLQGKKARMSLYWDGSNDSMQERHLLGAVHTGAIGTADLEGVMRVKNMFEAHEPPPYPYPIQEALAQRGAAIYARYCADCHGNGPRDFAGERVGGVTPLRDVGTDPGRIRAYTEDVVERQRSLSPDGVAPLRRFKTTGGYANLPLDGLWLRAPYLHNGSVPTLRALLEPSQRRPSVFYRGDWVYDPNDVGFVSVVPRRDGRNLFEYNTSLPGNSNRGHEGRRYGTELPPSDKDALIEYLKQF